MKIVCDECGAKYRISEDKVEGRVFKFKCNQCQTVITVDNSGGESVDDQAIWYIAIDDEQVGPITVSEIAAYISAGQFHSSGYVWKDGLPDWAPMSSIDELQHLIDGGSPSNASGFVEEGNGGVYEPQAGYADAYEPTKGYEAPSPAASQPDYSTQTYTPAQSDYSTQGGTFGSFSPTSTSGNAGDSAGGLFAAFDNPSSGGQGGALLGQRNESSVLFSLASLQQVSAQTTSSTEDSHGVTEGSGLIDIQALASAHDALGSGVDDGPDPFASSAMALPPLAPMGSHKSNKPLVIGVTVGFVLFISLIGVIAFLLLQPKETVVAAAPQVQKEVIIREVVKESESDKQEADEAAKAAAAAKAEAEAAEEEASPPEEGSGNPAAAKSKRARPRPTPSKGKSAPTPSEPDEPAPRPTPAKAAPEPKPTRKSSGKKSDGIDALLDKMDNKNKGNSGSGSRKSAPARSGGLSKAQVGGTIQKYVPRVSSCSKSSNKGKLKGRMNVKFNIRPNGSVTGVSITSGNFKGTDVGNCVSKVVRGMRFPSSNASENLSITFPFNI